jgi:hypothetical protein
MSKHTHITHFRFHEEPTSGFPYKESQFSKKDYHILYEMATPGTRLRVRLKECKFRDKKFQRNLINKKEAEVFYAPFNTLAMYINTPTQTAQDILKWRLTINK